MIQPHFMESSLNLPLSPPWVEPRSLPGLFVGQAREQVTKGHSQYKFNSSTGHTGDASTYTDEQKLEKIKEREEIHRATLESEFFEYTMKLRKYLQELAPDKDIEISPLTYKIIDKCYPES